MSDKVWPEQFISFLNSSMWAHIALSVSQSHHLSKISSKPKPNISSNKHIILVEHPLYK